MPTGIPTLAPTDSPSTRPTAEPTEHPTSLPTAAPTLRPTAVPTTSVPTTLEPATSLPTGLPTPEPTDSPSTHPTAEPTLQPTSEPTAAEPTTSEPTTSEPTNLPTSSPTGSPEPCLDLFQTHYCEMWSGMGHCAHNSDFFNFMVVNCRATCSLCYTTTMSPTSSLPTTTAPITSTPTGVPTLAPTNLPTGCSDIFAVAHCEMWDEMGHCYETSSFFNFMATNCRSTCSLCHQSTQQLSTATPTATATATTATATWVQTTSVARVPATSCQDSPVDWMDKFGSNCIAYRRKKLCTPEGGIGKGWDKWRLNLTIAESASASGVVGLVACCECGGGIEKLATSIDEEVVLEEGGPEAASGSDDTSAVEIMSYAASGVAALLSICALTVMVMYRNRMAQKRRTKNEKKRRMQFVKPLSQQPVGCAIQPQAFRTDQHTASMARSDRSSPHSSRASRRPLYLPNHDRESPVTLNDGIVLVDGTVMRRPTTPPRPRLFADHASSGSTDSDYAIPAPASGYIGFPGLIAASLVDGLDDINDDDVVLFEAEYADVHVDDAASGVASEDFSDLDQAVTVVSAAGGEQVLFAGDLERTLSRLTSIATHSTASSAATDVDYNGPSMANFFDQRQVKMARGEAEAAVAGHSNDDPTGAHPVGAHPASSTGPAEETGPSTFGPAATSQSSAPSSSSSVTTYAVDTSEHVSEPAQAVAWTSRPSAMAAPMPSSSASSASSGVPMANMANFFDEREAQREAIDAVAASAASNHADEPTTRPSAIAAPVPSNSTSSASSGYSGVPMANFFFSNHADEPTDGAKTTMPSAMAAPMPSSSASSGVPMANMANFFDEREARREAIDAVAASAASNHADEPTTRPSAMAAPVPSSSASSASSGYSGVPMANFFDEREARREAIDAVAASAASNHADEPTTRPSAMAAPVPSSSASSASSGYSGVPMANFFDEREAQR